MTREDQLDPSMILKHEVYNSERLQLDEILSDLEEHKELSANRLMELEKLTADHQEALKEIEKLKMDVSNYFSWIPL